MIRTDYTEGESERQLRRWGFELRDEARRMVSDIRDIWDHTDGRTVYLYTDGNWIAFALGAYPTHDGRGTASLMKYLRGE